MRILILALFLAILVSGSCGFEHPGSEVEDSPCNPCKRFALFDYLPIEKSKSKTIDFVNSNPIYPYYLIVKYAMLKKEREREALLSAEEAKRMPKKYYSASEWLHKFGRL